VPTIAIFISTNSPDELHSLVQTQGLAKASAVEWQAPAPIDFRQAPILDESFDTDTDWLQSNQRKPIGRTGPAPAINASDKPNKLIQPAQNKQHSI
jgi:hypothetical protein